MNCFERLIYSGLYLFFRWTGWGESRVNQFEDHLIRKYLQDDVEPEPIPTMEADQFNAHSFRELSQGFRRPVLIKGAFKGAGWGLDELRWMVGDYPVDVLRFEGAGAGKFPSTGAGAGGVAIDTVGFRKFVDGIDGPVYLNNNHTILSQFPELYDGIREPVECIREELADSFNLRNIHIANLFIGSSREDKVTGSHLHAGGSGNFFCMVRGSKKWTFIDPAYSPFLKPRLSPSGIHSQTLFDMPDRPLDSRSAIFNRLPRYEVVLEEGDMLYNAPWYWHRIENGPGVSIGLAIRNNKVTWLNLRNNPTFTLSGLTYLVYNSLFISLYERFFLRPGEHFRASSTEGRSSDVLYQIEEVIRRYPTSVRFEDIIL